MGVSHCVSDEMRTSKIVTLAMVAVLTLSIVGPAAAADGLNVSVSQDGDDVTVSVTQNNTTVSDASVVVETANATNTTYEEAGNYTTDDEGVVELSAPAENLTISVDASSGNLTASTTADLLAESVVENDTENVTTDADLNVTFDNGTVDYSNVTVDDSNPFGLYVSSFVHMVQDENVSGPMGHAVATFVTTFNPGNAPDHAGPPENKTQGPPENKTQGPPEDAGPPENKTQGPPEDAGPPENKTQGPPENKTQGPPEDAGPPEDRGPGSDDTTESDDEDDNRRGPPDHAGRGR